MSQVSFPVLKGQGWSVIKRPVFSTRVASHVSGREVRAANFSQPLWQFELVYEVLTDTGPTDDLRSLMGFFLERQGRFDSFLYSDPSDYQASGALLGTGDGITTSFACVRSLGGWVEPVGAVTNTPIVYLGGVAQTGGWTLTGTVISFATAPATGIAISADFTFAYLCRFLDDQQDYENFMFQLWSLGTCKFTSIKP